MASSKKSIQGHNQSRTNNDWSCSNNVHPQGSNFRSWLKIMECIVAWIKQDLHLHVIGEITKDVMEQSSIRKSHVPVHIIMSNELDRTIWIQ